MRSRPNQANESSLSALKHVAGLDLDRRDGVLDDLAVEPDAAFSHDPPSLTTRLLVEANGYEVEVRHFPVDGLFDRNRYLRNVVGQAAASAAMYATKFIGGCIGRAG